MSTGEETCHSGPPPAEGGVVPTRRSSTPALQSEPATNTPRQDTSNASASTSAPASAIAGHRNQMARDLGLSEDAGQGFVLDSLESLLHKLDDIHSDIRENSGENQANFDALNKTMEDIRSQLDRGDAERCRLRQELRNQVDMNRRTRLLLNQTKSELVLSEADNLNLKEQLGVEKVHPPADQEETVIAQPQQLILLQRSIAALAAQLQQTAPSLIPVPKKVEIGVQVCFSDAANEKEKENYFPLAEAEVGSTNAALKQECDAKEEENKKLRGQFKQAERDLILECEKHEATKASLLQESGAHSLTHRQLENTKSMYKASKLDLEHVQNELEEERARNGQVDDEQEQSDASGSAGASGEDTGEDEEDDEIEDDASGGGFAEPHQEDYQAEDEVSGSAGSSGEDTGEDEEDDTIEDDASDFGHAGPEEELGDPDSPAPADSFEDSAGIGSDVEEIVDDDSLDENGHFAALLQENNMAFSP